MKPLTVLVLALVFFCLSLPFATAETVITAPSGVVEDESVSFTITETDGFNGTAVSYAWDFGDGETGTSTTPSITHIYEEIGDYAVSCTVTITLELGEDWDVSDDWTYTQSYSASVTVAGGEARETANDVITNMYIVVTLLSTSLIVLAAGLILNALKNGEADSKMVYGGIVVLIISIIILVVGFNIVSTLEKSFDGLFFSLIMYIH